MAFPYTTNIPQGTQQIASTQGPLQTNNNSLNSLINVNHEGFASAEAGKHKFVEMPNQSADPAGATAEMTFYSKNYTKTAVSEAYVLRNDLAGPNTPIPFTACSTTNGWAWLPCGLLMKWGSFTLSSGTNAGTIFAYNTGINIPAFTAQPYMLQTSILSGSFPTGNAAQYHAIVYTPTDLGFTVKWDVATAVNLNFVAIGPATP